MLITTTVAYVEATKSRFARICDGQPMNPTHTSTAAILATVGGYNKQ
jgi:hypothetical protein